MSNIQKQTELDPKVKAELAKYLGLADIQIGDMYMRNNKIEIVRITNLKYIKKWNNYYVYYQEAIDWECTEWEKESCSTFYDFDYYGFTKYKITGKFNEWREKSLDVIEGRLSIDSLADNSSDNLNAENAIMARTSKEGLIAIQKDLEQRKKQVDMIKAFVSYEMEKRKQALEEIKYKLALVVKDFKKKIERIMRVIATIELYLGINEELFQIQTGDPAPADTPISFRQMVLYMDEEVGVHEDGGLDFTNINVFDEWLLKSQNLQQVLPEKKGIVVFNPRRQLKDYQSGDPAWEAAMNKENLYTTYMLIRNGGNLYRIYTKHITILQRLFPLKKELKEMLDEHDKITWEHKKEEAQEQIEDAMYKYRKRAVLLQGLIDRTEIFHPMAKPVNIFKMDETPELINFIYDDEASLPSGRLSFWDWHNKINKKIGAGSRIIIADNFGRLTSYYGHNQQEHNYSDRWYKRTASGREVTYDMPTEGVYEVQSKMVENRKDLRHWDVDELAQKGLLVKNHGLEYRFSPYPDGDEGQPEGTEVKYIKKDGKKYIEAYDVTFLEEHLVIYYKPDNEVYKWGEWGSKDRTNRVAFRIYPTDDFVINYDQVSLEDIDFYLNSRVDRENYLDLMPLLKQMKKQRLLELEGEKHFAQLLIDEMNRKNKIIGEDEAWKAINWWKFKNKIKRPIDKDDAKALRMILKHLNK